jgi:hypothetical protein
MALGTWLRALDLLVGVSDLARRVRKPDTAALEPTGASRHHLGQMETRLAAAAVAAIKEAFDRDSARLQLERERAADDERRLAAAARAEASRQSGERRIAEHRMHAAIAVAAWIASVLFAATWRDDLGPASRVLLGAGWLLLLFALAACFTATSRLLAWLDDRPDGPPPAAAPGATSIRWLLVLGLACTGAAVLVRL